MLRCRSETYVESTDESILEDLCDLNMYSTKPRSKKSCRWIRGLVGGIVNGCRAFCLQTSIHGLNHIAAPKRHWIERLVWVCVTAMAVWGVVDISVGQWQRYRDNSTVVTLERDFRTWSYTMPGATACEVNRTNAEKVENAIRSRWNVTRKDSKYEYYSRFVDVVTSSDLYHLEGYEEFSNDPDLNVDLYELAVDVMPDQRVKLSTSDQMSSNPRWVAVMTEVGVCYTVNSLAVADAAILDPNANITRDPPATCKYSPHGCFYIFESSHRANYYVHSAFDIPDTLTAPVISFVSLSLYTELSTTETCSGPGVRALPPSRRYCHYSDEPTEPNRQAHSNNICRQGCKSRIAVQLCGCKPFYYHFTEGPPCTPAGMRCVAGIAHRLATYDNIKCPCVQQCVDSVFHEISTVTQIWDRSPLMLRGLVRYTVQPPRMRYMRQIVFHFQDLVVSFGGAAGLFLGASLISFVEIAYFFIDRILCIGGKKTDTKILVKPPIAPYEYRIQELTSVLEKHNYY